MNARLPTNLHKRATACASTLGISMSELARRGVRALKNHVGVDIKTETTTRGAVVTSEIDATAEAIRRGLTLAVETCEGAMFPQSWELQLAIKKFKKACLRSARVDVGRVLAKVREVSG